MAKGYSPGANAKPYVGTLNEQRDTGVRPQLLNSIDEADVPSLISNPKFWMQEKFDGRRVLIRSEGGNIVGINRKGLEIALPESIIAGMRQIAKPCIIDGEAVGDWLFAFDLISLDGVDLRQRPYGYRLEALVRLVGSGRSAIESVETAQTDGEKHLLFTNLKLMKAEGVVFKHHDAVYTPGRPASGGSQLKFKFCATASCLVAAGRFGKRSVGLELIDRERRVSVGNVTIPPKTKMPVVGSIIEVKYLYAFPGGSLYQPVFTTVRDDIDTSACTTAQLKFKPTDEDDDAS